MITSYSSVGLAKITPLCQKAVWFIASPQVRLSNPGKPPLMRRPRLMTKAHSSPSFPEKTVSELRMKCIKNPAFPSPAIAHGGTCIVTDESQNFPDTTISPARKNVLA